MIIPAEQILESFGIPCTWARTEILYAMINDHYEKLTVSEIHKLITAKGISISKSAILSTLSLFKARGLIADTRVDNNSANNGRVGRPEAKFIATLELINTMNNHKNIKCNYGT